MQTLTLDNWQFKTVDLLHKQAMFEFAKFCGVPVPHPFLGHHDDGDAFISWFGGTIGLGVLPTRVGDYRVMRNRLIHESEFMDMCRAYQAEQSAPVANLIVATT